MSQRQFLQDMDAEIAMAMLDCGMADQAAWTSVAGGSAVPCLVMLDHAEQFFSDVGPVAGRRVVLTLFLAEITAPARGDRVVVDGQTWLLDDFVEGDESKSSWVVTRG